VVPNYVADSEEVSQCMQLICAVDYCHQQGIVHRDLKLENTLLSSTTSDAIIKLCDFG